MYWSTLRIAIDRQFYIGYSWLHVADLLRTGLLCIVRPSFWNKRIYIPCYFLMLYWLILNLYNYAHIQISDHGYIDTATVKTMSLLISEIQNAFYALSHHYCQAMQA